MGSEREAYQANVTRYDEFISDQTSSMARAIGRVGVMAADQERETAVEEIEGARVLTNGYFDSILKLRRDGADARTKVSRLTASIEETKGTLRATEREMTAIEQEIKHRGLPTAASCAPSASSSRR
jgi:chromosome segregation ATPase